MVFSDYTKQQILHFHRTEKLKSYTIASRLKEEGITVSQRGVLKMLKRFEEYGTIQCLPGSGRPSKVTAAVKAIVDQEMRRDDETTAVQLYIYHLKAQGDRH